jgi:hypothetical protein
MDTDSGIARLARLDCCAVSDALDRLKLSGVVPITEVMGASYEHLLKP